MRLTSLFVTGAAAVAAFFLVTFVATVPAQGKGGGGTPPPPPPPPPGPAKYVFARTSGSAYATKMNAWDGSGKVTIGAGVSREGGISFSTYNGALAVLQLVDNGLLNIDQTHNFDLAVQRLDASPVVTLFHDPTYILRDADFIPGSPGTIAFNAMQWITEAGGATSLHQGLYQADLAFDGAGNITGLASAPEMVYESAPPTVVDWGNGSYSIEETMGGGTAWVSTTRVVQSFPTWTRHSAGTSYLRVLDLAGSGSSRDITADGHSPVVSPSGTKLLYTTGGFGTIAGGIYEANLDGSGSPVLRVPRTQSGNRTLTQIIPGSPAWYDDDNYNYCLRTTVDKNGVQLSLTQDIWLAPQGAPHVNLTADSSELFFPIYVR